MHGHKTLIAGAAFGFLGVVVGAFGAHALSGVLAETGKAEAFELAVRYQYYHAVALLFLGIWRKQNTSTLLRWAAVLWTAGVLFFCGSLYGFSLTDEEALVMITPVGGMLLLCGWLCLLAEALRSWNRSRQRTPSKF